MQSYISPSNLDLNHEVATFPLLGWHKCSLLWLKSKISWAGAQETNVLLYCLLLALLRWH